MTENLVELPKQIMLLYPLFEKVGEYYFFKNREIWHGDLRFRYLIDSKTLLEVKSGDFISNDQYTLYATLAVDDLKPRGHLVVKNKELLTDKAISELHLLNIKVVRPIDSYKTVEYPMTEIHRRYTIGNIIDV